MRIKDAYDVLPKDEDRSYRVPYLQIQEMFDIGFYSTFEDGQFNSYRGQLTKLIQENGN